MAQRSKYAARPITNGSVAAVAQAATTEFKRIEQALNDQHGLLLLGRLRVANMNSTADQSITLLSANYVLTEILVTNASISLTTAAGGIYTAAAKAGTAVVAAAQVYSALTASTKALRLTIAAAGQDRLTATPLYFSLTTAQGAAATADLYVFGYAIG